MNRPRAAVLRLLILCVLAGASACASGVNGPVGPAAGSVTPAADTGTLLVGAGDIARCGSHNDDATARLLDSFPTATVFTAGDNAYPSGTIEEFRECYDGSWGRHKDRTHPAPGNHEYFSEGAAGYYEYFGDRAGDPGKGYYSYDLADWHVISLNSNIPMVAGSPQERWLRADLAAAAKPCVLAYWHAPRFSSGSHGNEPETAPLWDALYDAGADVIVGGHDHTYERFARQTPGGVPDSVRGIRQFVVGTGGAGHYQEGTRAVNSEVFDGSTYGILKLTLGATGYAWEFVPAAGGVFRDRGTDRCQPKRR